MIKGILLLCVVQSIRNIKLNEGGTEAENVCIYKSMSLLIQKNRLSSIFIRISQLSPKQYN